MSRTRRPPPRRRIQGGDPDNQSEDNDGMEFKPAEEEEDIEERLL
jgi:hypothetical protein